MTTWSASTIDALQSRVRRLEAKLNSLSSSSAGSTGREPSALDHSGLSNLAYATAKHTGFAGARRDVYANRGDAEDYPGQWFHENRQSTTTGDRIWLSVQQGDADWDWLKVTEVK